MLVRWVSPVLALCRLWPVACCCCCCVGLAAGEPFLYRLAARRATYADFENEQKEPTIARRDFRSTAPPVEEYRANHRIRAATIRVIDPNGEQLGIMTPDDGIEKAEAFGMDLVEVAPKAEPPVCRIMDYGKFKYQQSKKKSSSGSDRCEMKQFRMRPNIGDHDLDTKLKAACEALESGDQVKLVMRLRGREHAYTDRWVQKLGEVISTLKERVDREVSVTQHPKVEGRQIGAVVEPA